LHAYMKFICSLRSPEGCDRKGPSLADTRL